MTENTKWYSVNPTIRGGVVREENTQEPLFGRQPETISNLNEKSENDSFWVRNKMIIIISVIIVILILVVLYMYFASEADKPNESKKQKMGGGKDVLKNSKESEVMKGINRDELNKLRSMRRQQLFRNTSDTVENKTKENLYESPKYEYKEGLPTKGSNAKTLPSDDNSGQGPSDDNSGQDQNEDNSGQGPSDDNSGQDQNEDNSGHDQNEDNSGHDQNEDNSGHDQNENNKEGNPDDENDNTPLSGDESDIGHLLATISD